MIASLNQQVSCLNYIMLFQVEQNHNLPGFQDNLAGNLLNLEFELNGVAFELDFGGCTF